MVKLIEDEPGDINVAGYFSALVLLILFNVATTWYLFSYGLDYTLQSLSYPYSGYPVIVYSNDSLAAPILWLMLFMLLVMGVFRGVYELFKKPWLKKIFDYTQIALCVTVVLVILAFFVNSIIWKSAAREHGYIKCPRFNTTLVKFSKVSTAWTKEESLCHDYQVGEALSSGSHEDIIETAEYLKNR